MSDHTMREEYADALRDALIHEVVRTSQPQRRRRRRRLFIGSGIGLAAVLAGGGVAIASGVWTVPGGVALSPVSEIGSTAQTGSGSIPLGDPPAEANAVEVSFTCLTAGEFAFPAVPPDPSHPANPNEFTGVGCSEPTSNGPVHGYVPLAALDGNVFTVTTSPEARWTATANYATAEITAWGTNNQGEDYGVSNELGVPDLVRAGATNGKIGYVRNSDLIGTMPGSPEEVEAWQEGQTDSRTIPVYDEDGITVIGEFVIVGDSATE
ncbi:hypothetical protein [Leucobacter japonicus]|uniref:hypothetical protein n=1 Tax=Leucobacter japonicus TaxID=1461259 RepID=UPI0006A766A1|nr:hypothetical protein [Leucobacter japonicus]